MAEPGDGARKRKGFFLEADGPHLTKGRMLENPPSSDQIWPVTLAAASDSSQVIKPANSSAEPMPGNGYCRAAASRAAGLAPPPAEAGVSMIPGATALTRIRFAAYLS